MKLDILNALDSKKILKELNASHSKELAASRLVELKLPNKKSEKYRYFDIEPLIQKDWNFTKKEPIQVKTGKSIVIKNGIVEQLSNLEGVEVEMKEFNDIDSQHFDSLYYLSHLLCEKAIIIRVKDETKLNIEHIVTENNCLISYRIVILSDANTHTQIYETYSGDAKDTLLLTGYDIFISRDSTLKFIKNQTINSNSYTPISTNRYKVDSNATFKLGTFDFIKDNGLNIFRVELKESANFDASHLLYANGKVKGGTISEIIHEGKSSNSNQISKNILDNNARGIFDALIRVQNSAKWTKADQNSKSVLLHSGAYMASKPQLEIYIDDLEASHGSTTGQLDEAQLFYLQSRGINKVDAKKMLIIAFANEVISNIDDEYIKNVVHTHFESAYYGKSNLECLETCHSCEDMVLEEN